MFQLGHNQFMLGQVMNYVRPRTHVLDIINVSKVVFNIKYAILYLYLGVLSVVGLCEYWGMSDVTIYMLIMLY